jgi:SAM-dependent methyltransferase
VFDAVYPLSIRRLSTVHWTPIQVARKVMELLDPTPGARVLDVGSGAGKFCIIGSLLSQAHLVGVEQRAALVQLARETARTVGAGGAEFLHGDAFDLDWREYDRLYLYNPFEEELFAPPHRIDDTLPFSPARYGECVERAMTKLAGLPVGARVVLFHGFGGEMPEGFKRTWSGFHGSGSLERW